MKTTILATAIALASLVPAHSQENPTIGFCDDRNVVIKYLQDVFGQKLFAGGIAGEAGDSIIEIAVAQNGSWSVLLTSTALRSCIMSSGRSFTIAPVGEPT